MKLYGQSIYQHNVVACVLIWRHYSSKEATNRSDSDAENSATFLTRERVSEIYTYDHVLRK